MTPALTMASLAGAYDTMLIGQWIDGKGISLIARLEITESGWSTRFYIIRWGEPDIECGQGLAAGIRRFNELVAGTECGVCNGEGVVVPMGAEERRCHECMGTGKVPE